MNTTNILKVIFVLILIFGCVWVSGCKDKKKAQQDVDAEPDQDAADLTEWDIDGLEDMVEETDLTDGIVETHLIGQWHMDEGEGLTASDTSGHDNHGTLQNMDSSASWVEGRYESALRLDGTDDHVDCGDDESLITTDAITLVAWVNANDLSDYGVIAARGQYTYFFALNDANIPCLRIGDNTQWHTEVEGATAVADGWHHVAGTYDMATGEAKIYLDGFEDGSTSGPGAAIGDQPASLSLGSASSYTDDYYFDGILDEVMIYDIALTPEEILARFGFIDYGVGAAVAESRGVVTTETADGRNLVIANALDLSPIGYILVTDIDTQETTQYFCPEDVPQSAPYASLMASSGKFYTAQGSVFLEFDPAGALWTFHGTPSPDGNAYLSFTEGLDGTIWAGAIYQTTLISFDPVTAELTDHGRLDDAEMYLMHLADDDQGWIYGGIGTARYNIIAYNPTTGERRQLINEADRAVGTAEVYPTVDGAAVGIAGSQYYRLYNGAATPIDESEAAERRDVYEIYWGQKTGTFPDGRRLTGYNLPERWLKIEDPSSGATYRIDFDYETDGVTVTSLGQGPLGMVYGSTAHPMHFLALDTAGKSMEDYGAIPQVGGGNFCAIASQGDIVIGAQYSDGCLWAYDVTEPWSPPGTNQSLTITDTITIEAWVNANELSDYGIIATRGSYTYFFAITGANKAALLIGDNSDWNAIAVGNTTVQDGWYHVAGTYDHASGTARVYVNGVEDGSDTGSAIPMGDKPASLSVGAAAYASPITYHFSGMIDELRIYDTVLPPDEILRHYNRDYGDEDLRGLWHFDEASGSPAASDSSGNGNHVTLKNMNPSSCWVAGTLGGALEFDGIDDYADTADLGNPRVLAQWHDDICRPRTALAHPDGAHVMMAGFAGYGLVGGGIGIYNLETDEELLLTANEDLLPGLSTITLKALPDGNLVGGTSIEAPGGGHPTATEAELFILDWSTKQIIFHTVPVAGDGNIISIQVGPDGLVYGLSGNATFFVFDPEGRSIVHSESYSLFGGVPRHALHVGMDGYIYALMSTAILRITPGTFMHEKLADAPVNISAGGALANDLLCFASGSHVWSYSLVSD